MRLVRAWYLVYLQTLFWLGFCFLLKPGNLAWVNRVFKSGFMCDLSLRNALNYFCLALVRMVFPFMGYAHLTLIILAYGLNYCLKIRIHYTKPVNEKYTL
jgi:hypothetical protein